MKFPREPSTRFWAWLNSINIPIIILWSIAVKCEQYKLYRMCVSSIFVENTFSYDFLHFEVILGSRKWFSKNADFV